MLMLRWRCLLVASLLLLLTAGASADVTGRVFLDGNGNGRADAGEDGLADVPITDGTQFVRTDAEGRYSIAVIADPLLDEGGVSTLAVTCPSGYRPVGAWFHRLEDPEQAQELDFALRRDKQSLPVEFIHGTDPHVPRGGPEKFPAFRRDVESLADRVRFCVLTGDLVHLSDSQSFDQGLAQFDFLTEHIRDFPVALYAIPGNHDIAGVRDSSRDRDRRDASYAYGFYTRRVGPLRWSFNYGGVHFVGIDFNRKVEGRWQWGVPEAAVQWLEQDLSLLPDGTRVLLFVHAPVGDPTLFAVAARFGVEAIFHGHDHRDHAGSADGRTVISSGSISQIFDDTDRPEGYRLVRIDEDGLGSIYLATGDPHSLLFTHPRWNHPLKPGDRITGTFFDPDKRIQKLTLSIDGQMQDVPFTRTDTGCRFEHPWTRESGGASDAIPEIKAAITDGDKTWTCVYPPKK